MSKLKIKDLPQDVQECIKDVDGYDMENFKVIKEGEWKSDGKYDGRTSIFEYTGDLRKILYFLSLKYYHKDNWKCCQP